MLGALFSTFSTSKKEQKAKFQEESGKSCVKLHFLQKQCLGHPRSHTGKGQEGGGGKQQASCAKKRSQERGNGY